MKELFAKIIATGGYLPPKTLTNHQLSELVDTNHDWIFARTGIEKRHIAEEGVYTSELAYKASKEALANASIAKEDIDLIILATTTPDNIFPSSASLVATKLGLHGVPAFDVQAVCAGFIYALSTANAYIKSGIYKNILVIGAETLSKIVNWEDRKTCILFGDGAGAVLLQATEEKTGILATDIASDGAYRDILCVPNSGENKGHIEMQGQEVFKHAVSKMAESSKKSLDIAGLNAGDITHVIPHQANLRIMKSVAKKLNIDEGKLIAYVGEHANTSAASIPLALNEAIKEGKVKSGDIISTQAIGGGLAWGSAVIRV